MPKDRASGDGLLYLKEEELRSVLRNVPISDLYCVEDTVFARGKFATVRRALHKATGVQYAAKYIKKRRRNVNMIPEIYHEISVLLKCSSNNRVVRLYEVYETNSDMVLILGLAAGGELQRIFDGDQCLDEIEARRAMRQILEGLCFLHERNIAHLDLKPQNILLMVEDSCDDIKLCDFGISRLLEPGTEVRTLSGTPDYVAPEVVSYEPISLATDIWSVGVLAYVLLSGYTPFGGDTKEETSLNISKGIVTFDEDFVDISSVGLDFIKSILVLNPKKRPTVQELLQHPWINPQSHILPSLALMPNSDAINAISKSTPMNQRKSLPCLPESTPPSNNTTTTTATRTPFNSENLNDNNTTVDVNETLAPVINGSGTNILEEPSLPNDGIGKQQNGLNQKITEESVIKLENPFRNSSFNQDSELTMPNDLSSKTNDGSNISVKPDRPNQLINIQKSTTDEETIENDTTKIECIFRNSFFSQDSDVTTPNDLSSEVSSEEIEENFCLLKNIEKSSSREEFFRNEANSKMEDQEDATKVTQEDDNKEDFLSDSGIVSSLELETDTLQLNEINNDIVECPKKNEIYLCSSLTEHHEQRSEITIDLGMSKDDEICQFPENDTNVVQHYIDNENQQHSSEKTFINSYEVNKQIIFTLNYLEISADKGNHVTENPHVVNTLESSEPLYHRDSVSNDYLQSTETILHTNNVSQADEETEYGQETSQIYVNTFEIKNEKSDV